MGYYAKPELGIISRQKDVVVVKIPFAMKNDFKSAFRGARWDAERTAWSVPSGKTDRLEAWIAARRVDFEKVLDEYEELKAEYEAAEAERYEAEGRARALRMIEQRKREALLANGEIEFARHASVQDAIKAFSRIINGAGVPRQWARIERNEGKAELMEILERLWDAGLESKGIDMVTSYNMNRITRQEASAARAELFVLDELDVSEE